MNCSGKMVSVGYAIVLLPNEKTPDERCRFRVRFRVRVRVRVRVKRGGCVVEGRKEGEREGMGEKRARHRIFFCGRGFH